MLLYPYVVAIEFDTVDALSKRPGGVKNTRTLQSYSRHKSATRAPASRSIDQFDHEKFIVL